VPVTLQASTPSLAVLAANSGLNAGDKVVTEGQLRLADGSAVSAGTQTASAAQSGSGTGSYKRKSSTAASSASSAPAQS
jgi:hypothetical protein